MHGITINAAFFLALCAMSLTGLPTRATAQSADTPRADVPPPTLGKYGPAATKKEKMASCMALWEADTHMTRPEWKNVCLRIETEK